MKYILIIIIIFHGISLLYSSNNNSTELILITENNNKKNTNNKHNIIKYKKKGYSKSYSKTCKFEWISKISIANFENESEKSSYSNFTEKTIYLNNSTEYKIILTPSYAGMKQKEHWKIWIDYNKDGNFRGTNELVYDSKLATQKTIHASISIPKNTHQGNTRLRICMKYDQSPRSNEIINFGEVEDYTVNIQKNKSLILKKKTITKIK